jgi:hypothetical protein
MSTKVCLADEKTKVHTRPSLSHYGEVERVLTDRAEVIKELARCCFANGRGEGEGTNAGTPSTPSYLNNGPKQVDWEQISIGLWKNGYW